MITCILLSAGESQRFGTPKAIAKLNGKCVMEHLLEQLLNSNISQTIIVLGSASELIEPFILEHKTIKVVYNKDHNFGQTSSFKVGLQHVDPTATGILLLPVDYPAVTYKILNSLIRNFEKNNPKILIPKFGDRKGHPPIFSAELKEEILALGDHEGINSVANNNADDVEYLSVQDPAVVTSFNTQEEFIAVKEALNLL